MFTDKYTLSFLEIMNEIDCIMEQFSHSKKDLGYGSRWRFENGMRFDLIDYTVQGKCILRVGRGAWLIRTYPILNSWFDVVSKVIAKLELKSTSMIHEKNVLGVLKLLQQAPNGIGVL